MNAGKLSTEAARSGIEELSLTLHHILQNQVCFVSLSLSLFPTGKLTTDAARSGIEELSHTLHHILHNQVCIFISLSLSLSLFPTGKLTTDMWPGVG